MKIELKHIRHDPILSIESEAFSASIYVEGYHAGFATNHGLGLGTDISSTNEKGKKLLQKADAWCLKQPPIQYQSIVGFDDEPVACTLLNLINIMFRQNQQIKTQQQFLKKITPHMPGNIIMGLPYQSARSVGLIIPISILLRTESGRNLLTTAIQRITQTLKEGEKVLNTNIPEGILQKAGLNEGQYIKEEARDIKSTTVTKKEIRKKL